MAVRFTCDSCGRSMVVRDALAGTMIDCPWCKARVTVPAQGSGAEPGPAPGVPQPSPAQPQQPGPAPVGGVSREGLPSEQPPGPQKLEVVQEGVTRQCPYCKEFIQPTARKCRYCGEFLDDSMRRKQAGRDMLAAQGAFAGQSQAEAIKKKGSRALLFAILGIFICGIIFEPIALIYGLQALSAAKESKYPVPTGSATAAVVIASIMLVLMVIGLIAMAAGGM